MANSLAWINATASGKNFVQQQDVYVYPAATPSVASITNVAGRAMIVILNGVQGSGSDIGTITVSDTNLNSYSLLVSVSDNPNTPAVNWSIVYIAYGISGGANTVTWSNSGASLTDKNIELIEFSGVTGSDGTVTGLSNVFTGNIVTTKKDCFVGGQFDENSTNFTSWVLTPGSISSTVIHSGGHFDHSDCWLNSAVGFSSGTYTFTLNTASTRRIWWVAALQ